MIFLIRINVDKKKSKKIREIKFTKKEKNWRIKFWNLSIFLTINRSFQQIPNNSKLKKKKKKRGEDNEPKPISTNTSRSRPLPFAKRERERARELPLSLSRPKPEKQKLDSPPAISPSAPFFSLTQAAAHFHFPVHKGRPPPPFETKPGPFLFLIAILQHSKTSPFLSSRWPSHANSLHTLPPLHLPLIPLSVAAKTDQPSLSIVLSFLSFSVNQTPHFFLQPTDHNKPATQQVFPLSADFLSPRRPNIAAANTRQLTDPRHFLLPPFSLQ